MVSLFNKRSMIVAITVLFLILMLGCSGKKGSSSDDVNSNKNDSNADSTTNKPSLTDAEKKSSKEQQQDNSQETLLDSINKLAKQGKIINCDFAADTNIGAVEEKWGKADKSEGVVVGKTANNQDYTEDYRTYSKHNVAFGYNKGGIIFEARSFDPGLCQISLSMVKKFFGTPSHDVRYKGEEILGYTAGKDFKILFVFPQPVDTNNNPLMRHYSILYPDGTANSMADYPGREW